MIRFSITSGGQGGRIQYGFNTDYRTAKVEVQTNIVNGNKEAFGCQVDQRVIAKELNLQLRGKQKHNEAEGTQQKQG